MSRTISTQAEFTGQPQENSERSRTARDPRALDRVMLEVVAQLEVAVRRYPWQWFQFAPFWPEPEVAAGDADEAEAAASRE